MWGEAAAEEIGIEAWVGVGIGVWMGEKLREQTPCFYLAMHLGK